MLKNKYCIFLSCLILSFANGKAQILTLDSILSQIEANNPQLKMYDADIRSMNAAAEGAKSWMAPQVNSGFFMTPYNPMMWKADGMNLGMGSFMIGALQMIPNKKKQDADFNLMNAMSLVEKENKNYTLNQLYAIAKFNYYQSLVLQKKIKIANENLLLLDYMIKSMEIRYQYNMDKLPTYYKAIAQKSELQSMVVMLNNDISQKRIMLNTLMSRDKNIPFEIDTNYQLLDFKNAIVDTTSLNKNRSDLRAIDRTMEINELKIQAEKARLLPEFGIKYDHMFTFGRQPQLYTLMGMAIIPMPWSTKMNKASINSYNIKNESLNWQKKMILNEATGMLSGMNTDLTNLKKQYEIAQNNIIPSLKKSYETAVLTWQNNTGDLFLVLDAWEALNMSQMDALDKLYNILSVQVEIEKQLETK